MKLIKVSKVIEDYKELTESNFMFSKDNNIYKIDSVSVISSDEVIILYFDNVIGSYRQKLLNSEQYLLTK